jgi:hypothetical protein
MHNEFTAVFERDGDWVIAYCPEIPGANGQGRTKDEARDGRSVTVVSSMPGDVDWIGQVDPHPYRLPPCGFESISRGSDDLRPVVIVRPSWRPNGLAFSRAGRPHGAAGRPGTRRSA